MRALPGPFSSPHRRAPRTKSKGVLAMSHTLTATHVGVTRLAGHIGAEITGVDTGTPLSDEVIAKIRQTLLDHKVVFLRGQSLNYRRQVAFAERLGPLTLGHPAPAPPPPPGPPGAGLAARPAAAGGDRLAQGRQGQLLAHRRDVRRAAARLHPAARGG